MEVLGLPVNGLTIPCSCSHKSNAKKILPSTPNYGCHWGPSSFKLKPSSTSRSRTQHLVFHFCLIFLLFPSYIMKGFFWGFFLLSGNTEDWVLHCFLLFLGLGAWNDRVIQIRKSLFLGHGIYFSFAEECYPSASWQWRLWIEANEGHGCC